MSDSVILNIFGCKKKSCISRIIGLNNSNIFERKFLGSGSVIIDEAGLYEIRYADHHIMNEVYCVVANTKDGLIRLKILGYYEGKVKRGCEIAMKIATFMEKGLDFSNIVMPVKIGENWRYVLKTDFNDLF